MLDLSAAFFFFQLFYNLPSFTYFIWNSSIEADIPRIPILYQPLQVTNLKMVNSAPDLELYARITVCQTNFSESVTYNWKILPDEGHGYQSPSLNCSFVFQTTHYSSLRIEIEVQAQNGAILARGDRHIQLEKTWIAVLGDSFVSGEGNPEETSPAVLWQNEECHRSRKSFGYQVANKLAVQSPNKTFQLSFLACSGASTNELTDGYRSQLARIERISSEGKRGPNIVILTIGANDIGFSDLLQALSHRFLTLGYFESRFLDLSFQLDRVASRLSSMNVGKVVLSLYYDITRNENGEVDASCGAFGKVKSINLAQAEKKFFKKLNDLLKRKAERHGWIVVDSIPALFSTRGVCSSRSLVYSPEESVRKMFSVRGSFHPTEEGHRLVAEELLKLIH